MRTPFTSGLLVCSVLLASFGGLVACSSVLQATRLSKLSPRQPAEPVAEVPLESAAFRHDVQKLNAEAANSSPIRKNWGYQWVFIEREGAQSSSGAGYWVVKPVN